MRHLAALLPPLLLTLATPAARAEQWPEFRGPFGNGLSLTRGLPTAWGEKEHVLFRTAVHDKGWSSPVVWDRQVWLTTAREDGTQLFAVCVDAESGAVVHDLKLFDVASPPDVRKFNSYASPTPAVEAGRVYAHFGSPGTACLDSATGKVLWTRTDLPCNHFRGAASSPILFRDLVYLTFDGYDFQYVVALDKATGKTVWKKDRGTDYGKRDGDLKKAFATPTIIDHQGKLQLVSPSSDAVISYDPFTGEELWRVTHGGMNAATRPVYGHGLVFVTSGHNHKLQAIRPDGKGDVTGTHVAWTATKNTPTKPSPVLVGDLLFFVSDDGIASCVEAETGKPAGQARLNGNFAASPVCADGLLYFCNQDGDTFVVTATREMKVVATNKLDDGFLASPAVYGTSLLLRTRTHLYRIGKK